MKRPLTIIILAGATLLLGGCAVYPEYDPYYEPPVVHVPPPPPRIEYVGSPPAIGYVWIEGYWNWVSTRYVWVPGRWVAPRPGYIWVPHRWERHADHWRLSGGRWEREEPPRIVVPPPHEERRALPTPQSEVHRPPPPPRIEHRPPPPVFPPPPRLEPRPAPHIEPHTPERPPRIEPESRRPMELDPSQFPRRHAAPPTGERDERGGRSHEDRRDERRWRDRDGDGRPDSR